LGDEADAGSAGEAAGTSVLAPGRATLCTVAGDNAERGTCSRLLHSMPATRRVSCVMACSFATLACSLGPCIDALRPAEAAEAHA
jgi:hypothetical protein